MSRFRQDAFRRAASPGRPSLGFLAAQLEVAEQAQQQVERQLEVALAHRPLPPVPLPLAVVPEDGESLGSLVFRASQMLGLRGCGELRRRLHWSEDHLVQPNQVVQLARSLRCTPAELAHSSPMTIDGKSVLFNGHRLLSRHVIAEDRRLCPACVQEEGRGRREWQLRAVTVCPRHRVPLVSRCLDCSAPLTPTRPEYGRCRCGGRYAAADTPVSDVAIALASLIVAKFERRTWSPPEGTLGFPDVALAGLSLAGLLDLVCLLGMAQRDPAKFQLRRLEWPGKAEVGLPHLEVASHALAKWPTGLFARLREVRMYLPWEDSPAQVSKSLDHILRTATHHMAPDAGRLVLAGIAALVARPAEWSEHRRRAALEGATCSVS